LSAVAVWVAKSGALIETLSVKQMIQLITNISLVLVALLSLLSFGVLGVGRSGVSSFDGAYIFAAGRAWLGGMNPYDHSQLIQSVTGLPGLPKFDGYFLRDFFAYPPQVAVFSVPLGMLDYPVAKGVWLGINIAAIAAVVALTLFVLNRGGNGKVSSFGQCLLVALIVGNPFTTHVVWMGQSSLIAFAFTYAAWVFAEQKRWVLAGVFLGLASFKPQLCILVVIWFLLQRYWKTCVVAGGTILTASLYPIWVQGSVGLVQAWLQGLNNYKNSSFNAVDVGNNYVVGLQSLLQTMGIPAPSFAWLGLAIALLLWMFREKINSDDILGLLMATTVTFIYAHDYDYVCLIPAFVSLVLYTARSDKLPEMSDSLRFKLLIGNVVFALLLFLPQRLVRVFGVSALNHWRTVVIAAILLVLLNLSFTVKARLMQSSAPTYIDYL
jgi:Glycosyltransferase family 87